jgi:hypothetical protein
VNHRNGTGSSSWMQNARPSGGMRGRGRGDQTRGAFSRRPTRGRGQGRSNRKPSSGGGRKCGLCGQPGHNRSKCPIAVQESSHFNDMLNMFN